MSKSSKPLQIKVENLGDVKVFNLDRDKRFTLGYNSKNSLQLFGDKIPKRFDLLSGKRNRYFLKVNEDTIGEIAIGDSVLSIQDLIKHNLLRREKGWYLLELNPEKKASFSIFNCNFHIGFDGKVEVLSEVVEYWKLKRRIIRRLTSDWLFKSVLFLLLTFGGAFSYYVYGLPFIESNKINLESYTRHVAKVIIRQPQREEINIPDAPKELQLAQNETSSPETETKENPESTPAEEAPPPARTPVTKKGLLGLIGGKGVSDNPSTVIESLMDGGLVAEINDILNSGQNLEIELPSLDDLANLDLLTNSDADVDNLISEMQIDDRIELEDAGDVELQSLDDIQGSEIGLGYRDESSILNVLNSYRGRITYTYNKFLKQFPGLRGKIVLEITVNASGRVTDCKIVSSSLNNSGLEGEIVDLVKTFQFKPIPEGEVTFQNPFVFFRQDS